MGGGEAMDTDRPSPHPAVGQTDELAAAEAPERISDFMYTLME